MRISDFAIDNPIKVTVGVILIWMFGLIALFGIPVQLTPDVTRPIVSIRTSWPGASPQEMEKEIVSQQEEQLQDLEGVIDFRSSVSDRRSEVELEFQVGTDISSALLKVSNRLDQIEDYPDGADPPIIRTVRSSGSATAYMRLMPRPPSRAQLKAFRDLHPDLAEPINELLGRENFDAAHVYGAVRNHPELGDLIKSDPRVTDMLTFAEDVVAARIANVSGVADSEVYGGSELELRVIVDPVQLAARRITIAQLRNAMVAQNADVSAGDLWEGKYRYMIRTLGQFYSEKDVADVIVTYRDGAPVYVKDVATVSLEHSKTRGIGHQRGVEQLTIAVRRSEGANVLDVMTGVYEVADQLNSGVLRAKNLELLPSYDETVYIRSATRLVRNNMFIGGTLAIVVLLLFLRSFRSTLVVALAIPISCIGTFLVVRLLGRSINVISLAGMSFAVGMVVDSAIVVLENIYSHYQRGDKPFVAARQGTSEVWGAILASTLTTLAVFLPVITIEAEAGQLFRDIAIAISAGVSISLIVSLTVIPSAAARLLRDRSNEVHTPQRSGFLHSLASGGRGAILALTRKLQRGEIGNLAMIVTIALFALGAVCIGPVATSTGEVRQIAWPGTSWLIGSAVAVALFAPLAFRARRLGVTVTMIVVAIGLSNRLMLPAEYLPEGNKNLVRSGLRPPAGYSIEQMVKLGDIIESRLRPYWEAAPGSPEAEALDGPIIEDFFLVSFSGNAFMGARAAEPERAHELIPIMQRATSGLPGVFAFVSQSGLFERSRSGGRAIDIEITGPDLEKLMELGGTVMAQVAELYPPETQTNIQPIPSLELGSPELHIRRNREKAAERGVNTIELGYAINAMVDGAYAGSFWHEGKELDLKIYGAEDFSRHTQDIARLPIATPTGELVKIGDVADVIVSTGPETIQRIDRERAVIIQVQPGTEIALEDAMNTIEAEILEPMRSSGELSGLYKLNLAGTADDLRQMRAALGLSLILAVAITFLLIAALYESFVYPLVIMISVPMAAVGGFAGLRLQHMWSGQRLDTLTMLGFVILIGTVVNNAILIVNQALINNRRGMPYQEAVYESVGGRIRPIFMSTLTTVLGMLPLVLFPGAGSELYRGLGSVVVGGLLVSTIFTLFLVPMLFALVYELRERLFGPQTEWSDEPAMGSPAPG